MLIDLHCHTLKTKKGDAHTRNVSKEKFVEKIIQANVKVLAITNHNCFDYAQYCEFKNAVSEYCDIWPGIELDIAGKEDGNGNTKRGHLIVIANPKKEKIFSEKINKLIGNASADEFIVSIKDVFSAVGGCDCIYIPHFHKEPRLSEEDIQELNDLLPDSSRLFKETSDYRSLGVFSNFDYSVIIGSDVQDWDAYEKSKFADIRLPIQTFEQFCLLAKKDAQIINTLLNQKRKRDIIVSPCQNVSIKLPFYEDINVIFGQKGTGKSEILLSLIQYCNENGVVYESYIGNDKESDFSKLLKTGDINDDSIKFGTTKLEQNFEVLYSWQDKLPISIGKYINWFNTKDNNNNKSRMKITDSVHIEEEKRDKKLDNDYKYLKDFAESSFFKINFSMYIDEENIENLFKMLNLLCEQISKAKMDRWISDRSTKYTNWSIDKIKSIADRCSDTISKPSSTGFYEFAMNRFELYEAIQEIIEALRREDITEKEYMGNLEEKGDIYIQTRYRMLKKESRTDEFRHGINLLKNCKQVLEGIYNEAFTDKVSEEIAKYQECYDEGIKTINAFIGVSKEIVLENGEQYKPSNGERGILLMQRLLDSESDVYILDEPELGMGNSYITSNILPKLISLAKQRKTVIIATHNANIAVGTLPYVSIMRTHENGIYKTYVGNPFCDELYNIEDNNDIKNWTYESMHTLEGGRDAFYGRRDIYESGKQNN